MKLMFRKNIMENFPMRNLIRAPEIIAFPS